MKRKLARELAPGDFARQLISGEPLVEVAENLPVACTDETRHVIICHNPQGREYRLSLPADWLVEVGERPE